jgi:hypothetical protein
MKEKVEILKIAALLAEGGLLWAALLRALAVAAW